MQSVAQRKQINRELQRMGLGHLKDANLIANMAFLVRDHEHFRGILMHMPMPDRREAYQALAPKLRFKAKSLEDYEIESRNLAEQKQLPHYDPATLEAKEWKPQEFHTRRKDVVCELCEQNHAVTGDGKWHHYGTAEQCVCAESRFYPEGYPVAPSHPRPSPVDEATKRLEAIAEEAINRDLREGQATQQNTLTCVKCTTQRIFRLKYRNNIFKVAAEAGWFVDDLKAYCPDCKPTVN